MNKDLEIIEAIKSGKNQWVLNKLYDNSLPKIKILIRKMNGTEDDALDIFQEVLIILFRQVKLNKMNADTNIDGYLYRISRNLYLNKLRRTTKFIDFNEDIDEADTPEIETHLFIKDSENEIMKLFNSLGDKCKDLLNAIVFDELNYDEVAIKFGFASGEVVKTQKYRCKKKMQELFQQNPSLYPYLNKFSI